MTARLVGRTGTTRGLETAVGSELTVGSGAASGLRIESPTVSRRHARIVHSGAGFFVEDLGSRNGTFLNGQRIKRFQVRHLDVLSMGPEADLIFLEGGVAAPAAPAAAIAVTLTWLDGPLAGRTEPVRTGHVLGRRPDLPLPSISRRHAILNIANGQLVVEDLGSANGTRVNGTLIAGATPLADGDEVSLGEQALCRVSIRQEAPAAPRVADDDAGQQTMLVDRAAASREAPALDAPMLDAPGLTSLFKAPAAPEPPSAEPQPAAPTPGVEAPLPSAPAVAGEAGHKAPPYVGLPVEAPVPSAPAVAGEAGHKAPPYVGLPVEAPVPSAPPAAAPEPAGETMMAPREAARAMPQAPRVEPPAARPPAATPPDGTGMIAREPAMAPKFGKAPVAPPVASAPPAPAVEPPDPSHTSAMPREAAAAVPKDIAARAREVQEAAAPKAAPIAGVRLEGAVPCALARGTFTVGRSPQADVHVERPDVGRAHARLHVGDEVTVEDLGSANGTFVNGVKIAGTQPLPDGSRIRFATVDYTVRYVRSEG